MVSLAKNGRFRQSGRRRDFAPATHHAPVVAKRLSYAYHHEPTPKWRKWLWLSIFVFVAGLILAIMYSPLFTIENVIVSNVGFRPTEQRLQELINDLRNTTLWGVFPQSNLIFFSTAHARAILAREFYIEEVSFSKHWPNVLKIKVKNNVIVAVLKTGAGDFLVDRRGILVQQLADDDQTGTLPLLKEKDNPVRNLGDEILKPEIITFIDELYDAWQQQLPQLLPQDILLDPTALPTLQVNMPAGWYVNVTGESAAEPQVDSLKRLIEERIKDDQNKLQYIDVRFGNRLYFKLK